MVHLVQKQAKAVPLKGKQREKRGSRKASVSKSRRASSKDVVQSAPVSPPVVLVEQKRESIKDGRRRAPSRLYSHRGRAASMPSVRRAQRASVVRQQHQRRSKSANPEGQPRKKKNRVVEQRAASISLPVLKDNKNKPKKKPQQQRIVKRASQVGESSRRRLSKSPSKPQQQRLAKRASQVGEAQSSRRRQSKSPSDSKPPRSQGGVRRKASRGSRSARSSVAALDESKNNSRPMTVSEVAQAANVWAAKVNANASAREHSPSVRRDPDPDMSSVFPGVSRKPLRGHSRRRSDQTEIKMDSRVRRNKAKKKALREAALSPDEFLGLLQAGAADAMGNSEVSRAAKHYADLQWYRLQAQRALAERTQYLSAVEEVSEHSMRSTPTPRTPVSRHDMPALRRSRQGSGRQSRSASGPSTPGKGSRANLKRNVSMDAVDIRMVSDEVLVDEQPGLLIINAGLVVNNDSPSRSEERKSGSDVLEDIEEPGRKTPLMQRGRRSLRLEEERRSGSVSKERTQELLRHDSVRSVLSLVAGIS